MKAIIAGTAILLVLAAVHPSTRELLTPESPLITSCEEAVAMRLKVPSSYDRIDARYDVAEATAEEAAGELMYPNDPDFVRLHKDKLEIFAEGAFRHRVQLDYEAQNAFGVPLRLNDTCTYYDTTDAIARAVPAAYIDLERVD